MADRKNIQEKTSAHTASVTAHDLGMNAASRAEISPRDYAISIRVLRQNWRQGTVGCKTRSEVNRTGKKPFKQKGTGRARAGTAGSPLWRGGGIAFGPQPRVRTLSMTRKARARVMEAVIWSRLDAQQIVTVTVTFPEDKPKTAIASKTLRAAGLADKKVALFIAPHDYVTYASFVNLKNVRIFFFDQPNAYDLSWGDVIVYQQRDNDLFKEMVAAWN